MTKENTRVNLTAVAAAIRAELAQYPVYRFSVIGRTAKGKIIPSQNIARTPKGRRLSLF